jgi:CheY-like chemotaxis protein
VTFTVTLTGGPPGDPVTVAYSTSNGTAGAPADYVATTGSLTFAPGEATKTVEVLVVGDSVNELAETFNLNLQNPINAALADAVGVATITDNGDPVPTMSVSDAAISEGPSGTKTLAFTVRLSAPSGKTVTAAYATANGTAVAGPDYQARSGVVSFSPGAVSQTVSVPINGDAVAELDESLFLNLSAAANATLADAQAVGTIQDDDSLVVDDVTVAEGDAGAAVARAILMLSSDQRVGDAARARALGITRYLVKPVKRAALLATIVATLRQPAAPAAGPAAPAGGAAPAAVGSASTAATSTAAVKVATRRRHAC